MSETIRHTLDKVLVRLFSRKLMVWMTATGLSLSGNLSSEDWVAVSLAYIGSQAAVDLAATWRHGK